MRLLLFNWRDGEHRRAGGAEVYAERVAKAWANQGHSVTLLARSFSGAASRVERDGYTLLRAGNTLTMQWHAWRYYRRHAGEVDAVVEFVNALPFLAPLYVKSTPALALFHQTAEEIWDHELHQPFAAVGRYLIEPWWLRRYRGLPALAVSESTRASLQKRGIRDIELVPEGVERFVPSAPRPPKELRPTVLFVGRLTPNKRPDHAVAAFRELKERLPDAVLWVAGCGPMSGKLRAEAPQGTTFFGQVPEAKKYELMARAHVLVSTSVREGWGLTVSEAALSGTRAIAYDVAGLRDSVRAAGGVLVEPHPTALATALAAHLPAWVEDYGEIPADVGVRSWEDVAASIMDRLDRAKATRPVVTARPGLPLHLPLASAGEGPGVIMLSESDQLPAPDQHEITSPTA